MAGNCKNLSTIKDYLIKLDYLKIKGNNRSTVNLIVKWEIFQFHYFFESSFQMNTLNKTKMFSTKPFLAKFKGKRLETIIVLLISP